MLFSRNNNGSLWLCVNYRGLNKISKKDCYPLPLISDLLATAGKKWKTAFRTCYRSFEWMVMLFGLTNSLAAFQTFMNDIFSDMLDVHVIIYLDDILVYSDDHVREILRWLQLNGLYCKPEKCHFDKDTVDYLEFILSKDGLKMDPSKIQIIQDWP